MNETILLVEDEQELGMTLRKRLGREGYVVEVASDAAHAIEKATTRPCDLIILDATLSGRSRVEVCRDIREAGLGSPVLLLTPRDQPTHRVLGLKLGADDCVTEPFEIPELLARVEALLRRRYLRTLGSVRRFGAVHIYIPAGKVIREGKPVFLPLREFKLLCYFVEHAGIPLARDELLREVWGYGAGTSTRTVDVHVARLRRKLEKNPKRPELILTVAGIGYQFGG
ncbi:MAG TPA: response regulator transcription factor [Terriglobales bacterium]|nr:response regulator transcription factor [Terriglobales bacterium]